MFDVAVLGLGPAGATLARLLAPTLRVIAIDKKAALDADSTAGFHKPCGGLLALDAQKALARFDLTLPKELLVNPQIFAVRTLDLDSGLTRHYPRFYLNLDRQRLDRWLISLIPSTAEVCLNSECRRIERQSDGAFCVTFHGPQGVRSITTRYVVGADGANSLVRRTFFPAYAGRRYVSIQQWFPDANPTPFYSCVFDSRATDCYSWGISKDGAFVFGGAYPAQGCRARFEEQKQRLEAYGYRFGTPLKTEACVVLRPDSRKAFCTGQDGVLLVGEAAGFISPSSLEGISSALQSALLLTRAFTTSDPPRTYARLTRPLRARLLRKWLKCPFLYWPFLRRLVMKSGLQSIELYTPEHMK